MVLPLALFSFRSLATGPALVLPFIPLAFLLACNAEPTAAPGANAPGFRGNRRDSSDGSPADCHDLSAIAHCNEACYGRARNSDLHPYSHLHCRTSAWSYPDALTPSDADLFSHSGSSADNYPCTGGDCRPRFHGNPGPHSDCCSSTRAGRHSNCDACDANTNTGDVFHALAWAPRHAGGPVFTLRPGRLLVLSISRTQNRGCPGRHLRPIHRDMVREHQRDQHRAHYRPLRGPSQRPLRPQPSKLVGGRTGPA